MMSFASEPEVASFAPQDLSATTLFIKELFTSGARIQYAYGHGLQSQWDDTVDKFMNCGAVVADRKEVNHRRNRGRIDPQRERRTAVNRRSRRRGEYQVRFETETLEGAGRAGAVARGG